MNDIIQINYTIEKNIGIFRIFGDKFVENNRRHCKMIIYEEEMELAPIYDIKEENN